MSIARFALPLLCLVAMNASGPASGGETASMQIDGATVTYDTAVWRAEGEAMLTCIAPECAGRRDERPSVFISTRPLERGRIDTCVAFGGRSLQARDVELLSPLRFGTLGFVAVRRWSGCRALDARILEACAVHDEVVYELTNVLFEGCNHDPPLPETLFTDLLSGIRAGR